MRFLILDTDYDDFILTLYAQHPGLEKRSYGEQIQARMDTLFGLSDFYSTNLRKLGHHAYDVIVNASNMQKTWAREHGMPVAESAPIVGNFRASLDPLRNLVAKASPPFLKPLLRLPLRLLQDQRFWRWSILESQIEILKPDVLVNLAMDTTPISFIKKIKGKMGLLVGSAPPIVFLNKQDWRVYDLILTRSESMTDTLRHEGLTAELLRSGFEPRVLASVGSNLPRSISVSFVGSLGNVHSGRLAMLENLCNILGEKMSVWGPSVNHLSQDSAIRKRYQGPAYGRDSYRILASSKITVNNHIDIAGSSADNLRLFEATGMGALLITDWKVNLPELFEIGKEVVAYRSVEECAELIMYYMEHDQASAAIARAGQERTLRDHTYFHRMQELVSIVGKYL